MDSTRGVAVKEPISTTNACRMCMPLGASLAFAGVEGALSFLHGSQGCSTYIRRYLISHFNEPLDIASSSFGESATVFGGQANLHAGLRNVISGYRPQLIGVATTCLTETIGEDVVAMLRAFAAEPAEGELPALVPVATPSYAGTHADGYQAAAAALVATLAAGGPRGDGVALLPGIVSAADLRELADLSAAFGLSATVVPDYSDTLDGPASAEYRKIPLGGTPLAAIRALGRVRAAAQLGGLVSPGVRTAGDELESRFQTPVERLPLPIGLRLTDRFTAVLSQWSGQPLPPRLAAQRGRLIDAYVDGHKYLAGRRAIVFGDEDLVLGLATFLAEIGLQPVLCAGGGRSGRLARAIAAAAPELADVPVMQDADFDKLRATALEVGADVLVGHSKGYALARELGLPLVRVGLPIHDRLGGQRLLHLGYRGAQELFDRLVNTLIERAQDASPVGYSYM
jgi:nitrogenase molybdenum-iron protein NifN